MIIAAKGRSVPDRPAQEQRANEQKNEGGWQPTLPAVAKLPLQQLAKPGKARTGLLSACGHDASFFEFEAILLIRFDGPFCEHDWNSQRGSSQLDGFFLSRLGGKL